MPLTSASSLACRARYSSNTSPVGSLGYLSSSALVHHRRQQTRGFRFGRLWTSYLDPASHRDLCRAYRRLHYRYTEDFCQRLWDKHALVDDAKSRLKRAVNNYWYPSSSGQAGGRYVNTHASPKTPDNPEGIRPGQNIEDAERAPLEHFLFGGKKNRRAKQKTRDATDHERSSFLDQAAESEYTIDPITNRKVYKEPSGSAYSTLDGGVETPVKKSGLYSPQFSDFGASQSPVFHDGPPPESELKMYGQVKIDSEPWKSAGSSPKQPAAGQKGSPSEILSALSSEQKGVSWHHHHGIACTGNGTQELDADASRQESAQIYGDLDQYGAFRSHEPDGKYKIEQESPAAPPELNKYGAVRSHEPDGKYKVEQAAPPKPQELSKYGPVLSHEPEGKYAAACAGLQPSASELEFYSKPFYSHEPDGKYAASHVEPKYDPEELAKYQAFRSHEPDGKYAASHVKPEYDPNELAKYKAFRSHEPDGKYAVNHVEQKPDSADLAGYGPFFSHEPDGKYAATNTTTVFEPTEVGEYQAFRSHEPDGKYAATRSTLSASEQAELRQYQAFRSHEPDGKYAAEAASAAEAQDLGNHEAYSYEDSECKSAAQETTEVGSDPEELRKYQAVRWNEPDGKPADEKTNGQTLFEYDLSGGVSSEFQREQKTPFRKMVEELMAESAEAPEDTKADSLSSSPQPARTLTGNYVRDFPEEFTRSWPNQSLETTASLLSTEQKESSGVIQPSLERCTKPTPESVATTSAATTTYSEPTLSSQPATPTSPPEPTLYKVLVYDPTMQCIDMAETTSIVPDSAAPLTPAEVLLRISNPARFFPHFAPLQAQGFEIVSGSGDVLIFRKVREAVEGAQQDKVEEKQQHSTAESSAVNPIDMTGGRREYSYAVAAGRFASPTGFVNYDLPPPRDSASLPAQTHAAESPVGGVSVSATAREKVASDKEKPAGKTKSVTKRVAVGAAWLAGLSYSLGVVSEYFKTGGSDGKGPKGL
ncbi:hypothetical protein VTK26DRAFT_9326 [Humicola hyalothermophila]